MADHQTDTDDLVERLEDSKGWPNLGKAAAARIKELEAELQAAVAAAYKDAARLVETFGVPRDEFDFHNGNPRPSLAKAIRARARADSDALEAVKAEARAEALREAAWLADNYIPSPAAYGEYNSGESHAACQIELQILDLIPADQEGDG